MNDVFTKAYLSIINEWTPYRRYSQNRQQNPVEYPIIDVAVATKEATNDFKDAWCKGTTGEQVMAILIDMKDNGEKADNQIGAALVAEAFKYWETQSGSYAQQCKDLLSNLTCAGSNVRLLVFALCKGIKVTRFLDSQAGQDFKFGDKIQSLTLKYQYSDTSTYNYAKAHGFGNSWSYLNRDQVTDHYMFTCDKYPNVNFDIVFSSKTLADWEKIINAKYADKSSNRDTGSLDLREGDVITINAKVKEIDPMESRISMNYGKIVDIVGLSNSEK